MLEAFAIAGMLCALAPAALFCMNLRQYREPEAGALALPTMSVLIPARDEEEAIGGAIGSVLTSTGVEFEVVVMDDQSTDRTAAIVEAMADVDARVKLERAPALPRGWNGKQHACWELARTARGELLCFVDADVRLEPEALARMAAFLVRSSNIGLVSGFPRQVTETWLEWLLLPLIHFVLLGFLPVERMRRSSDPAFAAGCGQFMMVRAVDYWKCGGHAEIRLTMHDGLLLPRLFRLHGYRTDLADLTDLATCRMYRNARQVWSGLAKNATEGIAAPVRIVQITLLLLIGQVLPFLFAAWFGWRGGISLLVWIFLVVGMVGAWLTRVLAVVRFRQSWRGAILHPLGILLLLAVQWYALSRRLLGGTVSWKSRAYE